MIEPSALHVLFFLALCDTVMSVNWPGIYNEAIMMAYLDIPISGISLFSKVSIASEDIFLENLTRLPSKDVKSTSVGSSRPSRIQMSSRAWHRHLWYWFLSDLLCSNYETVGQQRQGDLPALPVQGQSISQKKT